MSSYSKNLCWHCSGIWEGAIPEQQMCASWETSVKSSYRKKKPLQCVAGCTIWNASSDLFWQSEPFASVYPRVNEASPDTLLLFRFYLFLFFFPFVSIFYFAVSKVSFPFCLKQSEKHSYVMPHGPGKALDVQQNIKQDHLELVYWADDLELRQECLNTVSREAWDFYVWGRVPTEKNSCKHEMKD